MIGPHFTEQEKAAAGSVAAKIGPETMEALGPVLKVVSSMCLAMFHEYLSVAVHGVLLDLVQWAEAGDDDAYGKAIQIDGRILVELRYFAERYTQARLEGDKDFLRMVANKTDSPG